MLKKPSIGTSLNVFFKQNWWLTGISNIILFVLIIYTLSDISQLKKDWTDKIDLAMSNVIAVTPDGRIRVIKRELVRTDTDAFQNYIKNLSKKMDVSESILTYGFDKNIARTITSPQALDRINEDFNLLGREFFDSKSQYETFLRYWYNELKKGSLPKKIQILSSKIEYTPLPEDRFSVSIELKTQKDFIDKISNVNSEIVVSDFITLEGFIRPSEYSTIDNPMGLRIDSTSLNIFTYENFRKTYR
ncbi:hypothetical protein [Poseidonibacter ostreae]|uniref:Uncharacterized protein n=1 Tax=Poseidonibacter ostreae TaxID=2654171 RepID=A0A6L4WX29_9BACT|nr:hypothetical protein [Poseidonibacter ostreae]KAB7891303.1 hypothetical protein GBG19_00270 [Poseidonibacter ostreae]